MMFIVKSVMFLLLIAALVIFPYFRCRRFSRQVQLKMPNSVSSNAKSLLFGSAYASYRLFVFFMLAIVFLSAHVLLSGSEGASIKDGTFSFHASYIFYCAPIAFYAWSGEIYVGDTILHYALGEKYSQCSTYPQSMFFRRRHQSLAGWSFVLIPSFAVSCITINWRAEFTPDQIIIQNPITLSEWRGRYNDIRYILTSKCYEAPSGKTIFKREYVVHFDNAMTYRTLDDMSFMSDIIKEELIKSISNRSGVTVSELDILTAQDMTRQKE